MYDEQWERAAAAMLRCATLPNPPLRYVSLENLQDVLRFFSATLFGAMNKLAIRKG
jgi:hypothetical protein